MKILAKLDNILGNKGKKYPEPGQFHGYWFGTKTKLPQSWTNKLTDETYHIYVSP